MDRLIGSYRPRVATKKWCWTLFVNVLNVSVSAAWWLWEIVNPKEKRSHIEFRREIVLVLLASGNEALENIPHRTAASLPQEVRVDGKDHVVSTTTQGRCKVCKKNCRKKCVKCDARLHTDRGTTCYYEYHNL